MKSEQHPLILTLSTFVVGPSIIKSARNEKSKAFKFGLVIAGLATIAINADKLAKQMGERNANAREKISGSRVQGKRGKPVRRDNRKQG